MTLSGLSIDVDSEVPVYRQIADGIRAAAGDGRLSSGRKLPPTRDLARQLGVNRNTVVAAYEILASEGFVQSHTGRGTFLVSARGWPAGGDADDQDQTWFTAFSRASDATAQVVRQQLSYDTGTMIWQLVDASGPLDSVVATAAEALGGKV